MDVKNQKEAFLAFEANAWFERNKKVIDNYNPERDRVITLIKDYNLRPRKVLEVGCSAGYRLNGILNALENVEVYGLEPSIDAIEYGKKNFKNVHFIHGSADEMYEFESDSLDIVIVGFVFYIIDRCIFYKVISEIDRVLKNGGILIIVDFFSESSLKNAYQHIDNFSAFTFKQNYDEVFTASKLYYLLDKSTWIHSEKILDASSNYHDKYSISLLKKDLDASYK